MDLKIYPSELSGFVEAPPSKSLTHRALIAAAFSLGLSVINHPLICEDTQATIKSLQNLGVDLTFYEDHIVVGGKKALTNPKKPFPCHESASTLRMLGPALSVFLDGFAFQGSDYLFDRVKKSYHSELKGLKISREQKNIVTISGKLSEKDYYLSGETTSQIITGMIMALPFLAVGTVLHLEDITIQNPYINMTIQVCLKFGVNFLFPDNQTIIWDERTGYTPTSIFIEDDFSNAAFWLGASCFNHDLRVRASASDSLQGDVAIFDFLKTMGISFQNDKGDFRYSQGQIGDATLDITETPDLGPILAAVASLGTGTVIIRGIDKLSYKESNRAVSIQDGINRLGGNVKIEENRMIIQGNHQLEGGCEVESYNDHRIVMALSILAGNCKLPFVIRNFLSVNKSYPNFFDEYQKLGGKVEVVA